MKLVHKLLVFSLALLYSITWGGGDGRANALTTTLQGLVLVVTRVWLQCDSKKSPPEIF